jgi:uncharacterized RDD family membrane protein YckC
MLCPSCGTDVGDEVRLCPACESIRKQQAALEAVEERELPPRGTAGRHAVASAQPGRVRQSVDGPEARSGEDEEVDETSVRFEGYGGFWLRFVAYSLDWAILAAILSSLTLMLPIDEIQRTVEAFGAEAGYALGRTFGSSMLFVGFFAAVAFGLLLFLISHFVIGLLYFAILESSEHGATPGKILLGLRVCDTDGNTLTLFEAALRHLAKIASYATLNFGFLLAGLTERKQALHDILAGTLVIKTKRVSIVRIVTVLIIAIALSVVFENARGNPGKNTNQPLDASKLRALATKHSAPVASVQFSPKTDGVVQVGEVNERVQGAVALFNPEDFHAYFFFFNAPLTPEQIAEIKASPLLETVHRFLPDLLIRVRFRPGTTTCDRLRVEQMQVSILYGKASLPTEATFNFGGVVADKLNFNCRLNDGAIYMAEFNSVATGTRVQIRWDVTSSGYLYFTESTASIPLSGPVRVETNTGTSKRK